MQLLSPGDVTSGASRVIKWNATPKVTNEMTTPIKEEMCYNSILHTEHKFLYLFSLLISSWGLNTDLNLKSNHLTQIRGTQMCIWAVSKFLCHSNNYSNYPCLIIYITNKSDLKTTNLHHTRNTPTSCFTCLQGTTVLAVSFQLAPQERGQWKCKRNLQTLLHKQAKWPWSSLLFLPSE